MELVENKLDETIFFPACADRLHEIITLYKTFPPYGKEGRERRWKAVQCFQEHWHIDTEPMAFADMLKKALGKAGGLLDVGNENPRRMIYLLADNDPKAVRSMFRSLYDESVPLVKRADDFLEAVDELAEKNWEDGLIPHDHSAKVVSVYLFLQNPARYYLYQPGKWKRFADRIGYLPQPSLQEGISPDVLRMVDYFRLCDAMQPIINEDKDLLGLEEWQAYFHADAKLACHLMTDTLVSFANSGPLKRLERERAAALQRGEEQDGQTPAQQHHWWLNVNPKYWRFSNIPVDGTQLFTRVNEAGHKRRVYQCFENIRPGDLVIGYEANPVKRIMALLTVAEVSGEGVIFRKAEDLAFPISYDDIKEQPAISQLGGMRGTLFALSGDDYRRLTAVIRLKNPLKSREPAPPYGKEDFLKEVYMGEGDYNTLHALLLRKKNIILQGPPGVGKTFAARRLAYAMMGKKENACIQMVQFHQSYSYEDFIMGYRPDGDGFHLQGGVFYQFCLRAQNHPQHPYFFIIDEINRGNLSKIFGELLQLIEKDYRGQPAALSYNGFSFSVPENVYIIGMMNTADRSLALVDYALRRRFSLFEMKPAFDEAEFRTYVEALRIPALERVIAKVKEVNRAIEEDDSLGEGFRIGHSYFCGQDGTDASWVGQVVEYDLIPLLKEYWYDDREKAAHWAEALREAAYG